MKLHKKEFKEIKNLLCANTLPTHDYLFELNDKASTILENENDSYRPLASDESSGSLLDFQSEKLPVVVIPDIHARPLFLLHILQYKILGKTTVFEALCKNQICVVSVGDILHSERNTRERWIAAEIEFKNDIYTGPSMSTEMQAGLAVWCGMLKLKCMFPKNFHILKGNHENIFNQTGDGDYSFRKYADEGHMVNCFVQEYYGDDILYMIHCVERALPLVFVGNNCVISHAEPKSAFTKEQIINARFEKNVVEGLTWTDNDEAEEGSVSGIIKNLCEKEDVCDYVYIGGHRPVTNKFEYRQNNAYIQIHNPAAENIAIINSESKFNPETDIVEVSDE